MIFRTSGPSVLCAAALAIGLGMPTAALASSCSDSGAAPSYGAFATGGINNSAGFSSCEPGSTATGYYAGTDNNNFTYDNSPALGSASGSTGTEQWGLSSASANLTTGDITVSATSIGNPPNSGNELPFGSPASALAGYFVQLVFSGGEGQQGSVSISGLMSYWGNVSVTANLSIYQGSYQGPLGGYNVVSGVDLPATSGEAWSIPAQTFTINDGVMYTLVAYVNALTSGSFKPGSVTVTDPLVFDLPEGVTFSASYPGFLAATATPLPASLPLFLGGGGLFGLLLHKRKRKRKASV